ncbi:site-specific DNA-methyltransferase [Pelagibius litoralis]|uniref:Methyltransferase n=1 Tax=Pelagibius litoralis TaxID=374515 RepID=A0A967F2T3_9PROT|nr:site-specific DNA-methyltransferase [Pelagibius litoralis]NIA72050.1 site-specific DNA-methyltransferase [Pelagibius litoralis]
MTDQVNTRGDILPSRQEQNAPKTYAEPCPRSLKGRKNDDFSLINPDLLENSKYGYYDGQVPWIVGNGDALTNLKRFPDDLIDCVVTSPPYYWQRDYEIDGQAGQEETVEKYVEDLTEVFREILRTLTPTGTAFVVLGDTYYSGRGQPRGGDPKQIWRGVARQKYRAVDRPGFGLPRKSLLGVPWRVALALQADGWVLRSSVIWRKPKPLAEPSVRDRPWTTTETIFILSKTGKYYFDRQGLDGQEDVWDIPAPNAPRKYRHAAPFPEALVNRCLAAGCPKKGIVLDPYTGSGTTLAVAAARGLPSIGIELNPSYCKLAQQRLIAQPETR